MNRFFVLPGQVRNSIITITGSDANHIKNVLRKQVNDEIICFDGMGNEYTTAIIEIEKGKIFLSVIFAKHLKDENRIRKILIQGLPKHSKMDEIVKKSTELGVDKIIPLLTERSIAKGEHLERWLKIAKEASQQSARLNLPEISPLLKFNDILSSSSEYRLKLIPFEGEKFRSIKSELRKHPHVDSIAVLIGPEGGFSAEEVAKANANGFKSVTLGNHILRTETAGPAVLAMINYEFELH